MIDWVVLAIYGTFLAIAVVAYLLSDFVFIGLGYIDNYYQERYFKKHFSKNKVRVKNSESSDLSNAA